jgi:hypothetical protein
MAEYVHAARPAGQRPRTRTSTIVTTTTTISGTRKRGAPRTTRAGSSYMTLRPAGQTNFHG